MARFRAHTFVTGQRPTQAGCQRSITERVTGTSRLGSVVAVVLATSMAGRGTGFCGRIRPCHERTG